MGHMRRLWDQVDPPPAAGKLKWFARIIVTEVLVRVHTICQAQNCDYCNYR